MRKLFILAMCFVLVSLFIAFCSKDTSSPQENNSLTDLSGPYLGQTPPGTSPVKFAEGIISTGRDWGITFSPDGKECFFTRNTGRPSILTCKEENGKWTRPAAASFSAPYNEIEPHITTDGNILYYGSERPLPGTSSTSLHQWYVEKTGSGWSESGTMDAPLKDIFMMYPSVADNGNMYFTASDDPAADQWISVSRLVNASYQEPEKLSDNINDKNFPAHPFIAADESYIIFDVVPGSNVGIRELFISFKNQDGTWGIPVSLHDRLDVGTETACPFVTRDGLYLFFEHDGDIYWVNAGIIDTLM
ncbi:hypothetical protein ACFL4T_10940, partial [candidate division KSB1 bacterium]